MLVVVVLLPLSSPMYGGEFDHGCGGGGCGDPAEAAAAAAAAAVEAVEDNLSAKAAGNASVDGRMTACNDEIRRWTTMQQPTNERWRGGGGSGGGGSATARGWRQLGGGEAVAAARKRDVGGSLVAARRWRQRDSATAAAGSLAASMRW